MWTFTTTVSRKEPCRVQSFLELLHPRYVIELITPNFTIPYTNSPLKLNPRRVSLHVNSSFPFAHNGLNHWSWYLLLLILHSPSLILGGKMVAGHRVALDFSLMRAICYYYINPQSEKNLLCIRLRPARYLKLVYPTPQGRLRGTSHGYSTHEHSFLSHLSFILHVHRGIAAPNSETSMCLTWISGRFYFGYAPS